MTIATDGSRESLLYKMKGHATDLGSWGHEFVRALCGEIGQEYSARFNAGENMVEDLLSLVKEIVPFHLKHNAEPEAVDILMKVQ